ncbi:MAG: adenylyltransferase/cytidyltransferase family protein [Candidatus Micrarchaeia archaeon]
MSKLVLTFGSFDLLHPGHLSYLESARKHGDKLLVVISRDESIKVIKGKTPLFNERDRLKMLKALKVVDYAIIGKKLKTPEDRYKIIKKYKPAVLAFGYDQNVNEDEVRRWLKNNNIRSEIVRIKPYKKDKYKSSIIKKILKIE